MGFFDFLNEKIAIDLGTSNTLITYKGKIAVNNPSIISIHQITGKIIAVGKEAGMMRGKINKNIKTISPFNNGVISNFDAAEKMLKTFIKKLSVFNTSAFATSYNMIIAIPCGSTEVEMRAVQESAKRLNAKNIFLIPEPIAAAIGGGIDVLEPKGNMVVDIGGGTTEIAVISLGRIISGQSVKIAGNVFNEDIIQYVRESRNLHIGESMAEKIKIKIGSAIDTLASPPEKMMVEGRDILTGKPKQIQLSHKEIKKSLDKSIIQIENAIMETLSEIPPEISADIYNSGIYLTGGGSMLRGLDGRLSIATELPVHLGDQPLETVVKGSDIVLKNLELYKDVLIKKRRQ
ncbi:rod shape-determining protein MreB [Aquimarina sp. MAR_2010_214]|uniref:rod shape-determining protein n=1 Tax=Aquimarina sp. MAR_2010_214 TaxID=1250026 RepID=UPI000C7018E6|nr:rod shape-determining protein [Aquimarina sp. MAR_2010_214]PKV51013.1 rod shape-determining protein MreB [Aquimarina sp. MAR_2010_214]